MLRAYKSHITECVQSGTEFIVSLQRKIASHFVCQLIGRILHLAFVLYIPILASIALTYVHIKCPTVLCAPCSEQVEM